ncbi:hypothetical protein Bcav_3617 [Beutenbergia cavernae DSM 12333]|uniref:Glycoside hydrolase family 2 sugar binding n=1 Tax=Beutenbergia cavernae (strain ATCC BAA-8 / DSM 12333 / CCUG 43141 / JCM 11478 / NBRC 16432 / NCIMB 13614 / HKI 0122) TaxID=471853 RepID=C5C315_BEUC1|nr:glycosyl hydrolase [Beutenbergia cavernae]ACQ81859.1 hypothetical protein Bcav_3617 [Beutenbergia cavernae DSM 12333]
MTDPQLRALLTDPPTRFGPTPLWWWSGERVTRERLTWQLDRLREGGVHDVVVINLAPAGPVFGATPDAPAWFSDAWWELFQHVCDEAGTHDMRVWFYDQIGFSGANVQGRVTLDHPWAAGRQLHAATRRLTDGVVPLLPGEELLAVFDETWRERIRADDGAVGGRRARDGETVRAVVTAPTAFDYLSPDAVAVLLDQVHGEFDRRVPEHLGSVIVGSFQDELSAMGTWTPRFAEEFRALAGYDLLDHLPALFTGTDRRARGVRADYQRVRARLAEDAFFRPLAAWHTERGMVVGADQSHPARAGYPAQSVQIYGDYARTHRWFGAIGSDHEGDAKVHSSLAHLYGHERVWIEAFHSSGWGATLEETYDWLLPYLRAGANLYNPHATYYSTVGGWFEWAAPATDWRQPYWPHYAAFARAVARIAAAMSWGTFSAHVALLDPTATAQAVLPVDLSIDHAGRRPFTGAEADAQEAQRLYLELRGVTDWWAPRTGTLDDAGVAFDVIDDDSLQRASSSSPGVLAIREQRYDTVLLPGTRTLETGTAEALVRLLDDGGRVVVVGPAPQEAAGLRGADDVVARLAAHPRLERAPDAGTAARLVSGQGDYATADVPVLVRRSGVSAAALVTTASPRASDVLGRGADAYRAADVTFDRARYAAEVELRVAAAVADVEVWDPATGESWPADAVTRAGGATIRVRTGGAPALVVTWSEAGAAAPVGARADDAAGRPPLATRDGAAVVDVSYGWTGTLEPMPDDRWGDLGRPTGARRDEVEVWDLEVDEGGTWAPFRATFGETVRVRTLPADAADDVALDAAACSAVVGGVRPLADESWARVTYSASRGRSRDTTSPLGGKGRVLSEFLAVTPPDDGERVAVRVVVRTDHRGPADLVLLSSAPKRVWWNGVEQAVDDAYAAVARVETTHEVNVLEYHLGRSRTRRSSLGEPVLGSGFGLGAPGTWDGRPEYLSPALVAGAPSGGAVRFRGRLHLASDAESARLVVGATTAARIRLDGRTVARQERVEYYADHDEKVPMFFGHDLPGLAAGDHVLELLLEHGTCDDVVYADLVAFGPGGASVLASDGTWSVTIDDVEVGARVRGDQWTDVDAAHAARRAHPLPRTDWLLGPPEIGAPALAVSVSDAATPLGRRFRVRLPAGTVRVALPVDGVRRATVDGHELEVVDGVVRLDPLPEPTSMLLETGPSPVGAGSLWRGPARIRTTTAPLPLGDWRDLGLASWSGGVTYRRSVAPPPGTPWVLDLGHVRGAVRVSVEGEVVAEAFCAPFRFPMAPVAGSVEVAVRVVNTLGPHLHASTASAWTFPSQLSSGLFGPVTIAAAGDDVRTARSAHLVDASPTRPASRVGQP